MTDEMIEAVARAMKNASRKTYGHWQPCDELEVMAKAAIAAHKSALAKAGLGIRPREATEEMATVGQHAYDKTACGLTDSDSPIRAAWQDMFDAHPDKPDG